MGQAIAYAIPLATHEKLPQDGKLKIDNNLAENGNPPNSFIEKKLLVLWKS